MKKIFFWTAAVYKTCSLLVLLFSLCFVGCVKDNVEQKIGEGLHKSESIDDGTESNIKIIAAEDFLKSDVFNPFIYDKRSINKDTTNNKGQHLSNKHYNIIGEIRTLSQAGQTVYVAFIKEDGVKSNPNYFENLVVEKSKKGVAGYIFRYGLDNELKSIKRLPNYNDQQYSKKYSDPTDPCTVTGTKYIPCPCQGHLDPAICECPTPPKVSTTTHYIDMCEKPKDPIGPDGPSGSGDTITFSNTSSPENPFASNDNNALPPVICLGEGGEEEHYPNGTSTPQLCATIEAGAVPATPVFVSETDTEDGFIISSSPLVKYPKGSNYEKLYPKFTNILKHELPKIQDNTKVIDAIHGITEAPKNTIKEALQWGKGPEIKIEDLGGEGDNETLGSYRGHILPELKNVLFIDIDLVNTYENSTSKEYSDAMAFLIAVTILHEYTHLGDTVFSDQYWGILHMENDFSDDYEAGYIFEENVFGEKVEKTNVGLILKRTGGL